MDGDAMFMLWWEYSLNMLLMGRAYKTKKVGIEGPWKKL